MPYKTMLLALLLMSLSSCAVYGGGSGYGNHRYDRGHSNTYYQVQRYPVYVVPQPRRYQTHRHDGRRYDDHRQPPRYYAPAPQPRDYQARRYQKRHDYRVTQPRAGWDGNRDHDYSRGHQQSRQQRYDAQRDEDHRRDERRGWDQQR
ncbi:hypothetical protein SAMN05216206_3860 [Pseudomonas guineae]|uniref:Lipoprotein n=1 Tax=Pseudomonas guineae TaxID=425504 RepID=A0A1I3Q5D1_9PSED|nr:hypothetical protein [Pseudomonas guineae]SFJ28905.1 hypothetical protein SAMN05216206_3860 [Pseudomonas guineae]